MNEIELHAPAITSQQIPNSFREKFAASALEQASEPPSSQDKRATDKQSMLSAYSSMARKIDLLLSESLQSRYHRVTRMSMLSLGRKPENKQARVPARARKMSFFFLFFAS